VSIKLSPALESWKSWLAWIKGLEKIQFDDHGFDACIGSMSLVGITA
jgi:hypothetical protein